MTSTHEQLYSQQSFRDSDGDIYIRQYNEETHSSGLIIPRVIGFASIQSSVTSAEKVKESDSGLVFEASSAPLVQNEIKRYAIDPVARPVFRAMSSRAIIDAYDRLVAQDLKPLVSFGSTVELDAMQEEERALLEGIGHDVSKAVRGTDGSQGDSDLPTGQYL